MLIGILSDIHSNYEALTVSYQALVDEKCDTIVCTGDIVGYGARPAECIEFIRSRDVMTIRGNHDHYVTDADRDWHIQPYAKEAVLWTRDVISDDDIEWLDTLPYKIELEGMTFVHASLEALDGEYWPYILDTKSALFHFFIQENQIAFFGHTHIPLLFTYEEGQQVMIEILKTKVLKTNKNKHVKYLINPGSVGQPRDFDSRASVLLFDTETYKIKLIRVDYDIDRTQKEILDAGLPRLLAARLSRGS